MDLSTIIRITTLTLCFSITNTRAGEDLQDLLNLLSSDSGDYYDESYVEFEEPPQPKVLPDISCNTFDEYSEDTDHIFVTTCAYATTENMYLYQGNNKYYTPNNRHLRFTDSEIEAIDSLSFNSNDPLGIPFNIKVNVLDLQNVHLQNIESNSFHSLMNLEDLNLSRNKLVALPPGMFNALDRLIYLDVSHNKLSGFLDWRNLTGLGTSLIHLDLSCNKIKFIRKHAFFNLTNLETLNLNSNMLAIIPGALFQYNLLLKNIFLSNNSISLIGNGTFAPLTSVYNLDLSENKLQDLSYSSFSNVNSSMESINDFNIESNLLENITNVVRNIEINTIFIRNNFIKTITGGKFCNKLDVSNMGLMVLSNISMCNSGSAVIASHNHLTDIPFFHNVNTVSIVDLQYNNISKLPAGRFSEFQRLITLRLDKNQLVKLEIGLFTNLDNLKSLNISFNKLEHVNQKVFYGLWQLENLYLGGNQLKTLPAVEILQRLRSLKLLGLNHNPWDCTELMDILHVLDMNNIQMAHHVKINYHTTNIGGVECTEMYQSQEEKVAKINITELKPTESSITDKPDTTSSTKYIYTTVATADMTNSSNNTTQLETDTIMSHNNTTTLEINTIEAISTPKAIVYPTIPDEKIAQIETDLDVTENSTTNKKKVTESKVFQLTTSMDYTELTTEQISIITLPNIKSTTSSSLEVTYTEQTAKLTILDNTVRKYGSVEYSDHFKNEVPNSPIYKEVSSMKSSIFEMKAVMITGILLVSCLICMKLYNFYRKNSNTQILTQSQSYNDSSIQSITTEIEM